MTFSDETVMAYADGELDAATRAAVELAMASDPDLAQRIARHRGLRQQLRREFDPVLAEPLPDRLLAAATGNALAQAHSGNVVTLQRRPMRQWTWPQWGAIAASLVVGLLLAPLLRRAPTEGLGIRDGKVLVSGTLAHALTEQLASTQTADAPVRVGVSFQSRNGDYCRTFTLHEQNAVAGVACRDRDSWRIEALAAAHPAASGPGVYQPAASPLPPGIEQSVSELIVGEPLDAKAEAAARARGWRGP